MEMSMEELIVRAKSLEIPNPTLFWLLPAKKRKRELEKAIMQAERSASSEE